MKKAVAKAKPIAQTITPPKQAKKAAPKKVQQKLTNEVAFALDGSGSMSRLAGKLIEVTNSWMDKIESEAVANGQNANITQIRFANNASLNYVSQRVQNAERLRTFPCTGSTALFDGVCMAIDQLEHKETDPNTSMLVIVVTDGGENNSSQRNVDRIGKLLLQKQKTNKWSFVFMVPPNTKHWFCSQYSIPTDNVTEWEATNEGMAYAEEQTSRGLSNYFSGRAKGLTATCSFYSQSDASNLTPKAVKKALTNIASECQVFEVPKEMEISPFVTLKTKQPYAKNAYYQLTKKETVQPSKDVLIMEKGKSAIYAGEEAREMIGLHNGATDKVVPGNHANFDIFVKSTSHNRKLVRGTKVIVRQ